MFTPAIIVPDGYNGDKIILDAEIIREDGPLVLLRCVEFGREHLTRWVYRKDYDHFVSVNKMVEGPPTPRQRQRCSAKITAP